MTVYECVVTEIDSERKLVFASTIDISTNVVIAYRGYEGVIPLEEFPDQVKVGSVFYFNPDGGPIRMADKIKVTKEMVDNANREAEKLFNTLLGLAEE